MRILMLLAVFVLWPLAGLAQDDDRSFLVGLLESNLGGEGRTVRIDGFAGALSSKATIERITVADETGVWLTVEDIAMQWNRSALFRATLDIQELRAARILMPRLPTPVPGSVPKPEATPFELPELPAALKIAQLSLGDVTLGASILGEAAQLSLSGAAELADGTGNVQLAATRLDGPRATIDLGATFQNASRHLDLNLKVSEDAQGLMSGLLNIADRPSLDLDINGAGPLNDFAAKLALRANDASTLSGDLTLRGTTGQGTRFDANLKGDLSAVVLPEYRSFFGSNLIMRAQGRQSANGALSLDQFNLDTRVLGLSGQAKLNAAGWPMFLDVQGHMKDPDGSPVAVPGANGTTVAQAALKVNFDANAGERLTAQFILSDVRAAETTVKNVSLIYDGTLRGGSGSIGQVAGRLGFDATGIAISDPALAQAVGSAMSGGFDLRYDEASLLSLTNMSLASAAWVLTGQAQIDGLTDGFETQFETALITENLSSFAKLSGLDLGGAGQVALAGTAALGGFFDVTLVGQTNHLAIGLAQADNVLAGQTDLRLSIKRDMSGTVIEDMRLNNQAIDLAASADLKSDRSFTRFRTRLSDVGLVTPRATGPVTLDGTANQIGSVWTIATDLTAPLETTGTVLAQVTPETTSLDVQARVGNISDLVPQITEAITLTATADQTGADWQFETTFRGPAQSTARLIGAYEKERVSARYRLNVPTLAAFVADAPGGATLAGDVRQTDRGWAFDGDLTGPYQSRGTLSGTYQNSFLTAFEVLVPEVSNIVSGMRGRLALDGTLSQSERGWQMITALNGPYASTGNISATLENGKTSADYTVAVPDVSPLVPGVSGSSTVRGTITQVGSDFAIDTKISGPSATTATANGLVRADGTLDVTSQGQFQLGLVNPFIAPRTVIGAAAFDLAIKGPASLRSVSGQIATQGARVAIPDLPLSISDLSGTVRLGNGQAALGMTAALSAGGRVAVSGPITLSGAYPAQLAVTLDSVVLTDPTLYSTTAGGRIDITGPLTGGAAISGQVSLNETNVQVPATGLSTFGAVPDIKHIGATRPVMRTRQRAGLDARAPTSTQASRPFPLDLTINAPNRIFVHGRGLDAELGGQVRLSGTTADILSLGQFDLIRGRLNILAKRFNLTEGRIALQGRFEPVLFFEVETNVPAGTGRIIVDGPADDPDVRFEASPEAPEDQVLAQILFARDLSQLSAFQALQLANAVASLAGAGGEGIVSQLRGSFGLDDLDVATDAEGNTAVRAGRYISENVYTDVTVGGQDGPEVSLNIDLTPNVTARGTVGANGNTGVGIFFERDY